MTDEQIMQGLKWCYQVEGSCGDCPYRPDDIKKAKCHDRLGNDVIELIERQKAEIKMLKTENERVKTNIYKMAIDKALAEKARAEAIKEFAEKLKEKIISETAYGCDCSQHSGYYDYSLKIGDIPEYIDNLVKEMVGDSNAE